MSNARFTIVPDGREFTIVFAYDGEEIVWRGFKSLTEAGERIKLGCERLEKTIKPKS